MSNYYNKKPDLDSQRSTWNIIFRKDARKRL